MRTGDHPEQRTRDIGGRIAAPGAIKGVESVCPELQVTLLGYFRNVVPPSAFQLVANTLDQISSGAGGGKLSIGILGTLWAASNGMAALSQGLKAAYEIKEGRPWWQSRLIAAGLTLAFAIFTAAALILVLAGEKIGAFLAGHFGLQDAFAKAWNIGRWPVALVLVLIAVDLLYRFAPDPTVIATSAWGAGSTSSNRSRRARRLSPGTARLRRSDPARARFARLPTQRARARGGLA